MGSARSGRAGCATPAARRAAQARPAPVQRLADEVQRAIAIKEEAKKAAADTCSFPCVLRILPTCVFNKKDPIVLGCEVVSGIACIGTVVCVPTQGFIDLGRIASMEHNHTAVDKAVKGQSVAMKIQPQIALEATRMYGRHFDHQDEIVSRITRRSIDLLKEHFKDELAKDDWQLLVQLKKRQELHYNEII
jgi:translation initiation factor 5B